MPLCIELEGYPPSVNHTYGSAGRRRFKKPAAVAWESTCWVLARSAAIKAYGTCDLSQLAHKPLRLVLSFYRPSWKGKLKASERYIRKDIDNMTKLFIDAICKPLGLEDAAIIELKCIKVDDPKGIEKSRAELTFLVDG